MQLSRTKLLTVIGGIAAMITISGCGSGGDADLANGRDAFIAQCAECHTLAEARTGGKIGPDLDAAFAAARAAGGVNDATIEGIVTSQIADPRFTDPEDPTYMPAGLVEGDDARDVAAYVASVAGNPDVEPAPTPNGPGAQIFADNGCAACHSFAASQAGGRVGPNLDTVLLGQSLELIRESIIHPNAEISAGYPAGVMPETFGSDIAPEDLDLLIDYLSTSAGKTDPTEAGTPSEPAGAGKRKGTKAGAGNG